MLELPSSAELLRMHCSVNLVTHLFFLFSDHVKRVYHDHRCFLDLFELNEGYKLKELCDGNIQ